MQKVKNKSKAYSLWSSMRDRCNNPKSHCFKDYGGRGIKICDEWKDFEEFEKWFDNTEYQIGLSIDRKDNNGGYSPDNCRWATKRQQSNNRRVTIHYPYGGLQMTLSQISRKTGLNYDHLYVFIKKMKLPLEEAIKREQKRV
jgi:hypothetical protein